METLYWPSVTITELCEPKLHCEVFDVSREHRIKVVHQWNTDNDTVTFRQNRTWFFEPSLSNGKLDDDIVTVNIPAIVSSA